MLRGHRDLKVYQLAYKLAMEIFNESKSFPKEERYSLTYRRNVATNYSERPRKVVIARSEATWQSHEIASRSLP
jgi:hypothetical protein